MKIYTIFILLVLFCIGNCSLEYPSEEEIQSYYLLNHHAMWDVLERIFSKENILVNEKTFTKAGFTILHSRPSGMKVAGHPLLPRYLVKVYLEDHPCDLEPLQWMINRCKGADNVRKLITEKHLTCFTVPRKWIYHSHNNPPILLVEDMQVVSKPETKLAWKQASHKEIRQLYTILRHGFSSCYLSGNIPYTRSGKFSCIDTEIPYRQHDYSHVRKFLSPEMRSYWSELVKRGEKLQGEK